MVLGKGTSDIQPCLFESLCWCCSGMFFHYNTIMRWIFSKACLFQILLSPWIMPAQLNAGTGLIVKRKSITSHFSFVLGLDIRVDLATHTIHPEGDFRHYLSPLDLQGTGPISFPVFESFFMFFNLFFLVLFRKTNI